LVLHDPREVYILASFCFTQFVSLTRPLPNKPHRVAIIRLVSDKMKALFVLLLATAALLFLALAVSADSDGQVHKRHDILDTVHEAMEERIVIGGTTTKACSTTEKPCTTTEECTTKPCTTTEEPCTTTEECTTKPCTTTEKPCTTTEECTTTPCTTTEKPCTTTEECTTKPSTTTEKPCTTTEECTTTEKPCTTTEECTTKPYTTTEKPCTTTEECTTKPCTTTEKPDECSKEVCNWEKLEQCRESNSKKFEHCLYNKRWQFVDCNEDAEHKFKHCLRGGKKRDAEEKECDYEEEEKNNERWAECKREYDEDKEQCLVERKAAHADCWRSKHCRESKCLRWIRDCKPPVTTTPAVTTTGQPPVVSTGCPANDYFGAAADFNVYLTGSDKLIYDLDLPVGDIEGRCAVNGGLKVSSFGTAQNYACANTATDAKKYNLIVNGKMDYSNGQLFCGSSLCLASGNSPSLRQLPYGATNARASSSQDLKDRSGLDFVSTTGYLQGVSDYFCKYAPGVHDLLRVSVYAPADVSKIVVPSGGSYVAVVNIKGPGAINFSNFQIPSGVDASQVIYNVCGSNDVNISSFELNGHLLALNSDVVLQNGHVKGNVYARSLVGAGSGQVNLAPCPK
jgi:hypothetical protein